MQIFASGRAAKAKLNCVFGQILQRAGCKIFRHSRRTTSPGSLGIACVPISPKPAEL